MNTNGEQPFKPYSTGCLLLAAMLLTASLQAGQGSDTAASRLKPVAPFPDLIATAQSNHIALDQFDLPTHGDRIVPGDSVTMLVTLCEKGQRSQWLLYLVAVSPTPAEQKAKPEPSKFVRSPMTKERLEFRSERAMVSVRTLGPFADPTTRRKKTKVKDRSARFAVNQGFLRIGFDQAAAAAMRFEGRTNNSNSADEKITAAEDRAFCGFGHALGSYITIIQETKGLSEILFEVVDMPSLWSIARHGGVTVRIFQSKGVALADAEIWKTATASPVYETPLLLKINDQDALNVTMAVTRPNPPMLACGGIIGLLAERSGDKDTYLTLHVISARCHGE